jgi:co-chaperonin GroES (HSP10)
MKFRPLHDRVVVKRIDAERPKPQSPAVPGGGMGGMDF